MATGEELAAIEWYTARRTAIREMRVVPERRIEPKAHPNCYCYVEPAYLEYGQPVEVWKSILIATTCEVCEGLHGTIISEGPWFGKKT